MTAKEALSNAARAGSLNQFGVSRHARERMAERQVTRADIQCVLKSATKAIPDLDPMKWKIEGKDLDGDDLAVVFAFTSHGLVVTVI